MRTKIATQSAPGAGIIAAVDVGFRTVILLERIIYWISCILAALVLAAAVYVWIAGLRDGSSDLTALFLAIIALLILGVGLAARRILQSQ